MSLWCKGRENGGGCCRLEEQAIDGARRCCAHARTVRWSLAHNLVPSGSSGGQGPGLVNVLSLLSGYSRNLHMKVIFNFHTPFHTRTPHCLTRPQAVRVTRRQTVTHPQAVTRPGTGNVHGCPLTTPTPQGQPRARACEPHMQPSRREMWRQAWHMLGICMACSCLRICMACSGLPAVEGDVTELRK